MYVVTSLKELSDEFTDVPMRMQEHKRRIETFVKNLSNTHPETAAGLLERLGGLPDGPGAKVLLQDLRTGEVLELRDPRTELTNPDRRFLRENLALAGSGGRAPPS